MVSSIVENDKYVTMSHRSKNSPTSKSSWEFLDPLKILMFEKNFIQEKFSNTHKYLCVLENKIVQSLLNEYFINLLLIIHIHILHCMSILTHQSRTKHESTVRTFFQLNIAPCTPYVYTLRTIHPLLRSFFANSTIRLIRLVSRLVRHNKD
jgi:hypothetical protein